MMRALVGLAVVFGLTLAIAPSAGADDGKESQPFSARGRRDPFVIPMRIKEHDRIGDPADEPKPPQDPGTLVRKPEPKPDPVTPPDPLDAIRQAFAAKNLLVLGVIRRIVPEPVRFAAGAELLGATLEGAVLVDLPRVEATALVQHDGAPKLVAAGDVLEADLVVQRIERTSVCFRFRGVDLAVPIDANGT